MHGGYLCNAPKNQNIRAKKNMTKVNFWEDHVISTAKVLTKNKGFPTSNENDSWLVNPMNLKARNIEAYPSL